MTEEQAAAVNEILGVYWAVATGETRGAGGTFYTNGQGTLSDVMISVDLLERLARAVGHPVHGRNYVDRHGG